MRVTVVEEDKQVAVCVIPSEAMQKRKKRKKERNGCVQVHTSKGGGSRKE